MNKKPIFLDLDGVILDSEELILQQKEKKKEISWDDFFLLLTGIQYIKNQNQLIIPLK